MAKSLVSCFFDSRCSIYRHASFPHCVVYNKLTTLPLINGNLHYTYTVSQLMQCQNSNTFMYNMYIPGCPEKSCTLHHTDAIVRGKLKKISPMIKSFQK